MEIVPEMKVLKPRPYQDHLIKTCMEKNTIVYLPTGAGKTFIPLMVFKNHSADFAYSLEDGGKRSIFLASTKVLAKQQKEYFEMHTPFKVTVFTGDMQVDNWGKQKWHKEFQDNHIIVATYQIVLDVIRHSYLALKNINVIVYDECHNAQGEHPICQLMHRFIDIDVVDQPRIIGLTGMLLTTDRYQTIEQDLANFEKKLRCTVATVATIQDFQNVLVYSTNPQEMILSYNTNMLHPKLAKIMQIVEKVIKEIEGFDVGAEVKTLSDTNDDKQGMKKKLINLWKNFVYQAEDFGLYGASLAILGLIVELDLKKRAAATRQRRLLLRSSIAHAEMIRHLIVSYLGDPEGKPLHEIILQNCTDKLKTFIQGLETIFKLFAGQKINALVFVEQRFTAKVLYHILRNYGESNEVFPVRPDFMVGDESFTSPELEVLLQIKWNRQVLDKFRRNEVNLIVSTSVLEEGVDLQMCNIVVNYDTPRNFRSYVQRKGRARSRESIFLLMTETTERSKLLKKVELYKMTDEKLKEILIGKCVDREIPSAEEIDDELRKEQRKFVTQKGAVLEETSAIALLNRYLSSLPGDSFTVTTVEAYLEQINSMFRFSFQMPIQSPLKGRIYGDILPNKKLAKRSAAFNTCVELYHKGELSENLLPFNKEMNLLKVEDVYFSHWKKYKSNATKIDGTKKKKRYHTVKYPKQLLACQPKAGTKCFLYIIHTASELNEVDDNVKIFNKFFAESQSYGFLTTKKLPKLAAMRFFITDGVIQVKIDDHPVEVKLSEEELIILQKFHLVVFRDILRVVKNFQTFDFTNVKNSLLVVPTVARRIDMEFAMKCQELQPVKPLTEMERLSMRIKPEDYLYQVVSPWYRCDSSQRYAVTKVLSEYTPNSLFPNQEQATTYANYYIQKYGSEIGHIVKMNQFLVEVKGITKNLNLINPGMSDKGSKKQAGRFRSEILVPELCHNYNFPAAMWLKAAILPNTLHRLHFMLHAENLRREIDDYINVPSSTKLDTLIVDERKFHIVEEVPVPKKSLFGAPAGSEVVQVQTKNETLADVLDSVFAPEQLPVDVHRNWDTIDSVDLEYYIHFLNLVDEFHKEQARKGATAQGMNALAICGTPYEEAFNINLLNVDRPGVEGPQQKDVLCAITAAPAHDVFDMERYEVLGDAFLKFTTTLYLLQKHNLWHEGLLTSCKGKIVGNRNLFYCGNEAGISGIINASPFSVSDFIVPHMGVPNEVVTIIRELKLTPNAVMRLDCTEWEVINGRLNLERESEILEQFAKEHGEIAESVYPVNVHLGKHYVSDKTVSDAIEGILGVWCASVGIKKSFKILNYFQILPHDVDMENLLRNQKIEPRLSPNVTNGDIDCLLINYTEVQRKLQYEFHDRAYLLQALTHPSYPTNRATGCYQQLEFLGDAVLDMIVTSYIFEHCQSMDPGKMTDLRSALVNNITLACICVRNGFHKHILNQSPALQEKMAEFAKYQELNGHMITEHVLLLKEEDEGILAESIDVPKILGDCMEALLGAIFLDSGNDLKAVWRVIVHLMGREILDFTQNVPINAVRKLYETPGANPQFSDAAVDPQTKVTLVNVQFVCCNKFVEVSGFGSNKLNAKRAGAKAALQYLAANKK
ncbi:endoribonuclease dcr-1 isoform X2 [Lutzomyia longipalpis]|uniref:endoribonuclease dcr-1 isoform X2 n=1 Tax=Lutzomyia longipalpis TaxID=7200 RepID=UPI002484208D|nr:endoribonuclease dcr-1 isoform X2 [Lutzomyia longipalpis]